MSTFKKVARYMAAHPGMLATFTMGLAIIADRRVYLAKIEKQINNRKKEVNDVEQEVNEVKK
ncbi:hypothetical protein BDZ91DRAFT_801671 [Kalaharituber pfeilii]|nr:hypothetical protein BDZ91DRAFT_801671 [Kalaharituber pfeilii]